MRIYVGSLPNGYRLSELIQLFESFGGVSRVTAIRDFAFLAIYDNEAAQAAINALNCTRFTNQEIIVERARFPRRFQQERGFNRRSNAKNTNGQTNVPDNQFVQQNAVSYQDQNQTQNQNLNQNQFVNSAPYHPNQQNNGYQGNNVNSGWNPSNENAAFPQPQASRGRRGRRGGRGGGNQSFRPNITNPGTPSQTIQEISYDAPPLYTPTANQQYNQAQNSPNMNQQTPNNSNSAQPNTNNQSSGGPRGRNRGGSGGRRGRRGRGGMLRGSSSALQVSELEGNGANENGGNEGGVVVPDKAGVSSMEAGDRAKVGGTVGFAAAQHFRQHAIVMAAAPDATANGLGRGGGDM